jgi:hypothetical protein
MGFFGTIASIIVGGAVAAVTVVGLVSSTVDSKPAHSGDVSGSSQIRYGTR